MKNFIFLDTETTGLPKDYVGLITDGTNWPRIVQLGFIVTDCIGKVVHTYNQIIKPEGWEVGAIHVHGITQERAENEGVPLKEALLQLTIWSRTAGFMVAHNVDFDFPILQAEYYRLGLPHCLAGRKIYCTQKQTANIVRIKQKQNGFRSSGYKWPSLKELCEYCNIEYSEDAHDALADADMTRRCFWMLYDLLKDSFPTPYYYRFTNETPGIVYKEQEQGF